MTNGGHGWANGGHGRVIEGIKDKNKVKEGSLNIIGPQKGVSFAPGHYREFSLFFSSDVYECVNARFFLYPVLGISQIIWHQY
jgi:hypothetical protein